MRILFFWLQRQVLFKWQGFPSWLLHHLRLYIMFQHPTTSAEQVWALGLVVWKLINSIQDYNKLWGQFLTSYLKFCRISVFWIEKLTPWLTFNWLSNNWALTLYKQFTSFSLACHTEFYCLCRFRVLSYLAVLRNNNYY